MAAYFEPMKSFGLSCSTHYLLKFNQTSFGHNVIFWYSVLAQNGFSDQQTNLLSNSLLVCGVLSVSREVEDSE